MLSQLSRASRATVTRVARTNAVQVRGFIAPTVSRRADFVQELYLRELKGYKVPPVKESDSKGQVQEFQLPKTPASPEESNLASSLAEYETMAVELEGQDASAQTSGAPAAVPDWLEPEEEDEPHH